MIHTYIHTCPVCKKQFEARSTKVYCSPECREIVINGRRSEQYHRKKNGAGPMVYKRKCPVCGKEFTTTKVLRSYCSDDCRMKKYKPEHLETKPAAKTETEPKPVRHVVCKRCGKEFVARNSAQIYCSLKCREAEKYERSKNRPPKTTPEIGICKECGKEFTKNISTQIYCSSACAARFNNRKRTRLKGTGKKHVHVCLLCGKEYSNYSEVSYYCSRKCYHKANKRKNPVEPPKKKPRTPGEKTLEDYCLEAAMCGMSYGQYRAALSMGKTFEQLKRIKI